MKLARIVNSILIRFGYKIVTFDPKFGRKFTEEQLLFTEGQLLRALRDLSEIYTRFVFNGTFAADEKSLRLLSDSMYTRFGTGLYLIEYLHQSLSREGDVCEFGVGQGVISALLAHEIKNTDKNLWLFDSFEGFAKPSEKDILMNDVLELGSIEAYEGEMSFPEEMVRARLTDIHFPPDRLRIVPGFIERTIQGPNLPQMVCFAYVDFDFYEPILTALQFLDTVIQPGGFIIVDDYDCFSKGGKSAVDEFFESRKENYTIQFPVKTGRKFCIMSRKN